MLDSFRQILLRKSDTDQLSSLIKFIREDVLADMVLESLEKNDSKGLTASFPIRYFAHDMDSEIHGDMIRDALGHHASRYKAALADNNQRLANKHMKSFYKIINLAHRASKHSNGKLDISAVPPNAWERNSKLSTYDDDHPLVLSGTKESGGFKNVVKGWGYKGSNFSFLQGEPHGSYEKEASKYSGKGGYPLEEVKVNNRYIHIEDNPDIAHGHEKHEFDFHPIMTHGAHATHKRSADDDISYVNDALNFESGPRMQSYFERHSSMQEKDPEAYASRGISASAPVHTLSNQASNAKKDD